MSLLTASLYLLCLAFLFGSALFVYSRDPFSRLNASYALLAISLLGWVGTLFIFNAETAGTSLLWIGRVNFAAAALAAPATLLFVLALARMPVRFRAWIWTETWLWIVVSLLTGWIDTAETIQAGEHVTAYGILFPLYILHILFFTAAAIVVAFRPVSRLPERTRLQLRLVGIGIMLTAVIGITTNAVLPYFYDNFRYIYAGTLSTIFFLGAVAYAAVVHHLFNVRVIVRKTLVFAMLIAFALELYQLAVEFLTKLLPLGDPTERQIAAATVALTINAFTHEPLRQWLEQLADRLLAGKPERHPVRRG